MSSVVRNMALSRCCAAGPVEAGQAFSSMRPLLKIYQPYLRSRGWLGIQTPGREVRLAEQSDRFARLKDVDVVMRRTLADVFLGLFNLFHVAIAVRLIRIAVGVGKRKA